MTLRGELPRFSESDPAESTRNLWRLGLFFQWILHSCRTDDGLSLASLAHDERSERLSILGLSTLSSMSIAAENGVVLWTDDRAVASLGHEFLQIGSLSTPDVLNWLNQREFLDDSTYTKFRVQLHAWEFSPICLGPDEFRVAARMSNWDVRERPFRQLIRWFGDSLVNPKLIVSTFLQCLKIVRNEAGLTSTEDAIVNEMTRQLTRHARAKAMVQAVKQHLPNEYRFDPLYEERIVSQLKKWANVT